jgi:hypothetical protein
VAFEVEVGAGSAANSVEMGPTFSREKRFGKMSPASGRFERFRIKSGANSGLSEQSFKPTLNRGPSPIPSKHHSQHEVCRKCL